MQPELQGKMRPFFLRRKGYVVVARCWSPGHVSGDIDLIAWQGTLLCVVEVKTRTAHDVAAAEVQVDEHKRRMVRRLACHYVRQLPQKTALEVRFDVLSVYLVPGREKEFVHFEAAFWWSGRADSSWGVSGVRPAIHGLAGTQPGGSGLPFRPRNLPFNGRFRRSLRCCWVDGGRKLLS